MKLFFSKIPAFASACLIVGVVLSSSGLADDSVGSGGKKAETKSVDSKTTEISELLSEAQQAFDKGYYSLASTRLNQASNLVHQVETKRAQKVFPQPLAGWKTSEGGDALNKFQSLGIGSLLATGLVYSKGDQSVQMVLVVKPSTPQPLFDFLLSGLLLPRPGMEKIDVHGYTARYLCAKSKPADCDITLPIDTDYVLILNGKSAPREVLLQYAQAIDFDLLKTFR